MFLLSGVLLLVLMGGVGVIINVQSEQTELAKDQAKAARGQARIIQRERFDGYLKSCDAQNTRHDRTVSKIRASDISEESKQFRILLVGELQPFVKDCKAYAEGRVKE